MIGGTAHLVALRIPQRHERIHVRGTQWPIPGVVVAVPTRILAIVALYLQFPRVAMNLGVLCAGLTESGERFDLLGGGGRTESRPRSDHGRICRCHRADPKSGSAFELVHGHHLNGIPGQFITDLGAYLAANAFLFPDPDRGNPFAGTFNRRQIVYAIHRAEVHADLTPRARRMNDRNQSGPAPLPSAFRDILNVCDAVHRLKVRFRHPDRSRVSDTISQGPDRADPEAHPW
jgi:hypothetical protein